MSSQLKKDNWITIEIGNGLKTAADFSHAICDKLNMKVECFANDLMTTRAFRKSISETKQSLDLTIITPRTIGFAKDVPYGEFLEKLPTAGFEVCPAEVGPQLRIQYSGKKWLLIAITPIRTTIYSGAAWDDDDEPLSIWNLIFALRMTGGNDTILQPSRPELATSEGGLDRLISPNDQIVVIKPKSS